MRVLFYPAAKASPMTLLINLLLWHDKHEYGTLLYHLFQSSAGLFEAK